MLSLDSGNTTSDLVAEPAAIGNDLAATEQQQPQEQQQHHKQQQDKLLDASLSLRSTSWRIIGFLYTLVATVWVVVAVIVQYLVVGVGDVEKKWSFMLPDLGATPGRAVCMGLHFLGGSVITLLGVWQVCACSRRQCCLHLHRIGGRVYVVCSVATGVGGFGFILQQRVLAGGWTMTVSFSLYGGCVVGFAFMAYWKAGQKDVDSHRRWALRSFSMAIASFVYRVWLTIGFQWHLVSDPRNSYVPEEDRSVPFYRDELYNQISQWGFFVLNWLVVEWLIRAPSTRLQRLLLDSVFCVASAFVCLFAYSFAEYMLRQL